MLSLERADSGIVDYAYDTSSFPIQLYGSMNSDEHWNEGWISPEQSAVSGTLKLRGILMSSLGMRKRRWSCPADRSMPATKEKLRDSQP